MENQKEVSFEEAMQKLSGLSNQIEKGELSLDEAMTVYQQALEFVKVCNARLTEAEQQVKLIAEQEDGTVEFKDFKPIDGDRNS